MTANRGRAPRFFAVSTFVVTAAMLGTMSVYGYLTKKDLTSLSNFLFMGLIGIVIASLVTFFQE